MYVFVESRKRTSRPDPVMPTLLVVGVQCTASVSYKNSLWDRSDSFPFRTRSEGSLPSYGLASDHLLPSPCSGVYKHSATATEAVARRQRQLLGNRREETKRHTCRQTDSISTLRSRKKNWTDGPSRVKKSRPQLFRTLADFQIHPSESAVNL